MRLSILKCRTVTEKCLNSWSIQRRISTAKNDLSKVVPAATLLLHKLMVLYT